MAGEPGKEVSKKRPKPESVPTKSLGRAHGPENDRADCGRKK